MGKVPITFIHQGKKYEGTFSPVNGAGNSPGQEWHLMNGKFYYGNLHYSQYSQCWVFNSQTGLFKELESYFEAYLVGWFQ